jgi:hypothetical protein
MRPEVATKIRSHPSPAVPNNKSRAFCSGKKCIGQHGKAMVIWVNAQRFERCGVGKCFVGKWKNSTPTPIGPVVLKQTLFRDQIQCSLNRELAQKFGFF